jgi:putative membrane protein
MRSSWSATLSRAVILSLVVGTGIASAQSSPSRRDAQPQPPPDTGEHAFVLQAAMSNMAEIQLGHLATKNAQRADVKKFAQMMIDDHLKAQQQLADAAYGEGIKWPTKLDDSHRQVQQRLSKLNNEQFDREYMQAMVDWHRDVEKMLATRPIGGAAKSEQPSLSAKVNQWAAKTLPEVRAHLKEAEQVYGEVSKGASN